MAKRRKLGPKVYRRAEQEEEFNAFSALLRLMPKRVQPHFWDGPLPDHVDSVYIWLTPGGKWGMDVYSKVDPRSQMPRKKSRRYASGGHGEAYAFLLCTHGSIEEYTAYFQGTVLVHDYHEHVTQRQATMISDALDEAYGGHDWLYKDLAAQMVARMLLEEIKRGAIDVNPARVKRTIEEMKEAQIGVAARQFFKEMLHERD